MKNHLKIRIQFYCDQTQIDELFKVSNFYQLNSYFVTHSLSFFIFLLRNSIKKNINYDFSVKRRKDFRKFLNVFTHDSRCTEICSFFPYVMDRTSTRLRSDTDRVITASCCPRISLFYFMLIKYF